jgi:enolase
VHYKAFNVINGGSHAGNKLAMQEFMILPTGTKYQTVYNEILDITTYMFADSTIIFFTIMYSMYRG